MIGSIVATLGVALAGHGAWVLWRNPEGWLLARRNAYAVCTLIAAVGATLWAWGWETSMANVTGTLGLVLTVLGCLAANFISRRNEPA